jgi:hypothetical protein
MNNRSTNSAFVHFGGDITSNVESSHGVQLSGGSTGGVVTHRLGLATPRRGATSRVAGDRPGKARTKPDRHRFSRDPPPGTLQSCAGLPEPQSVS